MDLRDTHVSPDRLLEFHDVKRVAPGELTWENLMPQPGTRIFGR